AEGFEAALFASEPMITNPAAIDIDTQGRVWVAEIQWYRGQAKEPPADKIKVLEDTDGDGRADKVTVFAEGVFAPMSICVAGDKVYVATSPDLWVYEDKDGDLVADGPPTKLLTGFGGYNHDHGAHSLVLGPDHKWWMSHGDTGFNVKGTDGSHIEYKWGAMLRGELDGSRLETVAVNFRNPYEICVSSFGESFCSDNDNDGNFSVRICWILEGGNYGWFGAPPAKVPPGTPLGEHWHFRGHVPGFVPATLVTGFGSPCGICFYEGDAFGDQYKNAPLHTDAGPREVRIYRHEPHGAGMRATSRVFMSSPDDAYFRPDDICAAPDGTLYVADWYDGGVGGHAYNNPDQGRIFQLRPTGKRPQRIGEPGPYATVEQAIEGLKNPNLATQFLARERLLADGSSSIVPLKKLLNDKEPNYRARALWLLDRIGGQARQAVLDQLKSDDPAFRALAVRILRRHGPEYAEPLLDMAGDDSPEVRREVLLALSRLEGTRAEQVLVEMAASYDGTDRYLLEAIHIAAGRRKAQLYRALERAGRISIDKVQLLQVLDPKAAASFLAESLAATNLDESARQVLLEHLGGTASAEAGQAVLKLATDPEASADMRRLSLNLLAANLPGNWQALKRAPELASGLRHLLSDPDWQAAALALAGDNGLDELAEEILALVESAELSVGVRQQAARVAAQLRVEGAAAALAELLTSKELPLAEAGLSGLVQLQHWPPVREVVCGALGTPRLQAQAVDQLMSSTGGALVMLRLIDDQAVSDAVAKTAIDQAIRHPDSNIRVLFERFVPEDQRPRRLGSAVQPAEILALEADADRGRQIFFQSSAAQCKNCHRVQGQGGGIGPDLSQIGKKYDRAALLETILEPSKAVAPEYIAYLLETQDGLVHAGFVVDKSDEQVVLKDANNNLIRVPAGEVALLAAQQKSLMPELVLSDVTAQDAADLLAYLVSLNESVQAVTRFRLLGPFASPDKKGIDRDFGPESELSRPDLSAGYPGALQRVHWELAQANVLGELPMFDQVKHAQARGQPAEGVTNYFLVFADSTADQQATLLVGSDDSCRIWVNGREVHVYRGNRALAPAQDRVNVNFRSGRNTVVVKVENNQGPGGMALAIQSASAIEMNTE
ncbi:MAG: PVC-type heme-binding CxxCH protein, partial [Pirellulales bacterium]